MERLKALEDFMTDIEFQSVVEALKNKQRTSILTDNYFIKVGTSTKSKFFISLLNEILVYKTFETLPVNHPKMIWHYYDDNLLAIVLKRIDAQVLAERRDSFSLRNADVNTILQEIKKLEMVQSAPNWSISYHRDQKAEKYLNIVYEYLPSDVKKALDQLIGGLHDSSTLVFSHGDLLPMNILSKNNKYWFIDWEWAAFRPNSFDAVVFLLFSHHPSDVITMFEKLYNKWEPSEMYKDAVVIALREMKNWAQVRPSELKKQRIALWVQTLKDAVE